MIKEQERKEEARMQAETSQAQARAGTRAGEAAECGETWVNISTMTGESQANAMQSMQSTQSHAATQASQLKSKSHGSSNSTTKKKGKAPKAKKCKAKLKCVWCDNVRERHDLCGRCRQKVESRARRKMVQKINGDWSLFEEVGQLLDHHLKHFNLNSTQIFSLLKQIGPFWYLLRQAKKTYVAKRALQPWTLPDSSVLQLIQDLYFEQNETPKLNGTSYACDKLQQLDRKGLCLLLEQKVLETIDMFKNENQTTNSNPGLIEGQTPNQGRNDNVNMNRNVGESFIMANNSKMHDFGSPFVKNEDGLWLPSNAGIHPHNVANAQRNAYNGFNHQQSIGNAQGMRLGKGEVPTHAPFGQCGQFGQIVENTGERGKNTGTFENNYAAVLPKGEIGARAFSTAQGGQPPTLKWFDSNHSSNNNSSDSLIENSKYFDNIACQPQATSLGEWVFGADMDMPQIANQNQGSIASQTTQSTASTVGTLRRAHSNHSVPSIPSAQSVQSTQSLPVNVGLGLGLRSSSSQQWGAADVPEFRVPPKIPAFKVQPSIQEQSQQADPREPQPGQAPPAPQGQEYSSLSVASQSPVTPPQQTLVGPSQRQQVQVQQSQGQSQGLIPEQDMAVQEGEEAPSQSIFDEMTLLSTIGALQDGLNRGDSTGGLLANNKFDLGSNALGLDMNQGNDYSGSMNVNTNRYQVIRGSNEYSQLDLARFNPIRPMNTMNGMNPVNPVYQGSVMMENERDFNFDVLSISMPPPLHSVVDHSGF